MKKLLPVAVYLLFISACKKEKDSTINFTKEIFVVDENNIAVAGASTKFYSSENDLLQHTLITRQLVTGADGKVSLSNFDSDTLFAVAESGELTSEFSSLYFLSDTIGSKISYRIAVKKPTKTQWLCGHGSKNWFMDGYMLNGSYSFYPVTSTLHSNGTWTDSNNRSGSWLFVNNETQLSYDYFGGGMNLVFDLTEFSNDTINLSFSQLGYSVQMQMVAVY